MMKIKSSKTFVVKPAEKTPPGRTIPLSLIDRLYLNLFPRYNSTVHIYRPTVKVNAESLRESLSKVLVHFYPVAGRYVRPNENDDDVTEIHCNDEGVHYLEVESDSVVDDLGDLAPSLDFKSLVPFIDYTQPHVSSYPIMLVQVTYFRCGAVSLGIAMEHCTLDGSSAFHLINSWSEICRGGLDVSVPPFLDRTLLLLPRDPPQPRIDHQEYTSPGEKISDKNSHYKVSVFMLTKDQINEMKAIANQNQLETTSNFTTFEVLAGHTWKCVSKARELASDQDTRLVFPTNLRSDKRAGPLVPRGFFGNAIIHLAPKARAGDLKLKPLRYAASVIHDALARIDTEYTRSELDFLATQPDLSAARFGPRISGSPNFQVTSWGGLGLNDADFGWGPPVYSGPGWIQSEKAYIFSRDHVDGGLSLAIRLKAQHMEVFEKLFYEFA